MPMHTVLRLPLICGIVISLTLLTPMRDCRAQALNSPSLPAIVPNPAHIDIQTGTFTLRSSTRIVCSPPSAELNRIARLFKDAVKRATGFELALSEDAAKGNSNDAICLTLTPDANETGDEGYTLQVTAETVLIAAKKPAGLFYGCQTVRQMLPPEIENTSQASDVVWAIPCVTIKDAPRFGWRGYFLDSARQFQNIAMIKRYIDLCAYYKLNVFHWHLADDQGWRMEIRRYPKLTEVGAWRQQNGQRYGGFYTQAEIKDVIQYAQDRFLLIVPEIEMPGHCTAALAAFPELSCHGVPITVESSIGKSVITEDVFCVGNEAVFDFLQNVLSEVIEVFPSPYIHTGGDECPRTRWEACPKCQARFKAEGMSNINELQSYFSRRLATFLKSKNRKMIGWDEIIKGGLVDDSVVQIWQQFPKKSDKLAAATAARNNTMIMSPWNRTYLCYPYKLVSVESAYSFEPIPEGFEPAQASLVLGVEACQWITSALVLPQPKLQDYIDQKSFPRMCATAETAWSPKERRNWTDFRQRLQRHLRHLDALGVQDAMEMEDMDPIALQTIGTYALQGKPTMLNLDVTKAIGGPGLYVFQIQYRKGKYAVNIDWCALLEDGKEINRDAHPGKSGLLTSGNAYYLALPTWRKGARYTLQAELTSPTGDGSQGDVLMTRTALGPVLIGRWGPLQLQPEPVDLTWPVTSMIRGNGSITVKLQYTGGNNGLKTAWVALLENGKEVARDTHRGVSGFSHEDHLYHLTLADYKTGATYEVRANVVGAGGTNSNGMVWLIKD